MRRIKYKDEPYIIGSNIEFSKVDLFNLTPLTQIKSIGKIGSKSSHSRFLEFRNKVTYQGTIDIAKTTFAAFEICSEDSNLVNGERIFKLFTFNEHELFIPTLESQGIGIYKPIFH